MVRNSILLGTGESAPLVMVAAQAGPRAASCEAGRDRPQALGALGAAMVGGYLIERGSPLAMPPGTMGDGGLAVGLAGSAAMAALARR